MLVVLTMLEMPGPNVVGYDIVYVRAPRFGDSRNSQWPEVFNPGLLDAGADLMLLHPDGREEMLVKGGAGSVTDPFISFDALWCYYAYFPNLQPDHLNGQRSLLPADGADIYRINLQTRVVQRLTHQEFTPNTGAGNWDLEHPSKVSDSRNTLGYGILNLAPVTIAGGRIAFVSNRNGFVPTKKYTTVTMQLYVMDEDGENVTAIAPMTLGSAMHPVPLLDGRILFSSYETQGLRDERLWGLWAIQPDGRYWEPVVSAFHAPQAFHFSTQLSNADLVVEDYYNLNNNGFGALYRLPIKPPDGGPRFNSAFPAQSPGIEATTGDGSRIRVRFPFSPKGIFSITPFTHGFDEAAPVGANGQRVGRFTHPSAAPENDLLCVWSPGPANSLNRPTVAPFYDGGLYLIRGGRPLKSPADLVLIKNDPQYNEMWPRPVVTYKMLYGVDQPATLPWLPNDGSLTPFLPAGTPYGIVGTSSFYKRESFPGTVTATTFDGLDAFNTTENYQSSNWGVQGADAGKYSNNDIFAVRIVMMDPTSHRSYGPHAGQHFFNYANERMRILGEIPLEKKGADGRLILDPDGNPDTSFLARIPADTPFTFQMLDRDGLVLASAQTWHQVRPGEVRNDCGGCHAHSQQPLAIERTAAGRPGFRPADLTKQTPLLTPAPSHELTTRDVRGGAVDVEFYRDIRPILQRSCIQCHTRAKASDAGQLVLDDLALVEGLPGDFVRLAYDQKARWGLPPVLRLGARPEWRAPNTSRYIRMFQSRRSLLAWKIFGRRLDGWTNDAHPTETVPGDPATLPKGAHPNNADLDYTGSIMPPPGSGVAPLTGDERLAIVRWIDLGCPIDYGRENGHAAYGWFLDDLRPTLTVSLPRPNENSGPLTEIRIGVADAYSGIDVSSLSVTADVPISGRGPGSDLAKMGSFVGDGIFSIPLAKPVTQLDRGRLTVKVRDRQGNLTTQVVRFSVGRARSATSTRE
jgi:hypothetical protein